VSSFARRTAAIAGACASAWIASAHPARADDPLRVLLVGGAHDAEIVTRVEGQVADLDAELERDTTVMPSSPLPVQLVTARRLARAHTADVVVWFVRANGDVIVHVTDARGSRVLVRRVESADGAMAESAASEAAAVIVRTAIRGLAAGGEIGIEVKPEPTTPAPAPTTPAHDEEELGGVRPLRPSATIGWTSVYDGESSTGHHGVSARLGVAGGPWRFAVALTHRPSESLESQMATIDVERQTLGVALGLDVAGGAQHGRAVRWRVGADLLVAMTRFGRTTTSTGILVEPTADRATWSPTAAPSIRISRRIARGAWIELALGADLVAKAPEFGVSTPTGFATIGSLWPVEPHAGLGVVVDPF
jgi:hypothetical protein